MFIGNKKNLFFFEKAIESGNVSHAYCFFGPTGVGKLTFAKMLAAKILQVAEEELYRSPNFYYFEREIDEKTGKLKKELTVSQAREIKEKISKKSWGDKGQVFVINEIQYLNEEAGNALLKVLEDPAQGSIILLLADHEKNILPTILSRCQKVFFHPVSNLEILEELKVVGIEEDKAKIASLLSGGLPGKAISLAQDKEAIEAFKTEIRKWLSLLKMNFVERLESLESILSEKDGNKTRDSLIKKMDIWLEFWRETMLFKNNKKNNRFLSETDLASLNYDANQISLIIDELIKTQNFLKNNVQTRLAVEQFLLKF